MFSCDFYTLNIAKLLYPYIDKAFNAIAKKLKKKRSVIKKEP